MAIYGIHKEFTTTLDSEQIIIRWFGPVQSAPSAQAFSGAARAVNGRPVQLRMIDRGAYGDYVAYVFRRL